MIFKAIHKNNLALSNFTEIMAIAIEGKRCIEELEAHLEEHEATIETMEGPEHDYANEIADLSQALENEQTTKESLEETFALELSRLKESHERALEVANVFRTKNDKREVAHAKLLEDYEHLENVSRTLKSSLIEHAESHAQLETSYAKDLANTSSTCVDTNHVEEIKELKVQVTSLKKDFEKGHEVMSTLNNILWGQKSANDKGGLGFDSNKKKKSKSFKKKGQGQVKNSTKIIFFNCKIEGHHVKSCPLKKKPKSHKKHGKLPQVQSHSQLQVEERPLPKKAQDWEESKR
ncbi:hypothetical protein D1007_41867 [Hordeum vulgare]|nr:hypothetical protein D1007_41867 [Hordeum vulgare]